ncbi:hypothetical protein METBIDRAFT_113968 [Metschnikowia bicuspidata var. bicuspidata NRRL YB-4993]|uniref:Transmembrane protein n=1 Tax=Metschnikowia bicuspidata var. bicuspidata NRRL YB-4993 TaxID=869754 RepID=A0A1A0HJ27_9ASCO|nr:hypothetical protein METBIDRAFT_113968 [Metschnikowia bicuspidata var. bicuspidata NRRL YB-4993]OBA23843.1 hypothetical protein METBIDRAFT_113968 [Metschnikowia bicuspidata var. bicuspidata NRRL YB-4993]
MHASHVPCVRVTCQRSRHGARVRITRAPFPCLATWQLTASRRRKTCQKIICRLGARCAYVLHRQPELRCFTAETAPAASSSFCFSFSFFQLAVILSRGPENVSVLEAIPRYKRKAFGGSGMRAGFLQDGAAENEHFQAGPPLLQQNDIRGYAPDCTARPVLADSAELHLRKTAFQNGRGPPHLGSSFLFFLFFLFFLLSSSFLFSSFLHPSIPGAGPGHLISRTPYPVSGRSMPAHPTLQISETSPDLSVRRSLPPA